MKKNRVKKLTLSAMFLALALVLPFLTGQIPQVGSMLCPMHIPALLCGFFCGAPWGAVMGFAAPLLRSILFGMPPMFPVAVCMAFEMAVYGFAAGFLYQRLPAKKWSVYVCLIGAMIAGRIVWGTAMLACVGFDTGKFGLAAFISGAVTTALPGILVQVILVPVIVIALDKVHRQRSAVPQ